MTPPDNALERLLAELARRGYDDAKLTVARNVLGRFDRFLAGRSLNTASSADFDNFLAGVIRSGAAERAIAVFRQVLSDARLALPALLPAAAELPSGIDWGPPAAAEPPLAIETTPAAPPVTEALEPPAAEPEPPPMPGDEPLEPEVEETPSHLRPAIAWTGGDETHPGAPESVTTSEPPPLPHLAAPISMDETGTRRPPVIEATPAPIAEPSAETIEAVPVEMPGPPPASAETLAIESFAEPDAAAMPAEALPAETFASEPPAADLAEAPPVAAFAPAEPLPADLAEPSTNLPGAEVIAPEPAEAPPSAAIAAAIRDDQTLPLVEERRDTVMMLPPEEIAESPFAEPAETLAEATTETADAAEIVRELTPPMRRESVPIPANLLFESSAADLATTESKELGTELMASSFEVAYPVMLGQLEGPDGAAKIRARELMIANGDAAGPRLLDDMDSASDALLGEIAAILDELPGDDWPRAISERLASGRIDPTRFLRSGDEHAVRILLRRFPRAEDKEQSLLTAWIEANPDVAVGPLLEAQSSTDDDLRGFSVRVLGALGREEAVPDLIHGLQSAEDDLRTSSAMALVTIGEPAIKAIGEVLLRHDDSEVQYESARALGMIGKAAAVPFLIEAVRAGRVGYTAIESLTKIGVGVREPVEQLLEETDPSVRYLACEALGQLRDAAAMEPLMRMLLDPDTNVQNAARDALGKLGVDDAAMAMPEVAAPARPRHDAEVAEARARWQNGDAAAAEAQVKAIVEADPNDAGARLLHSELALAQGRSSEALAGFADLVNRRHLLEPAELAAALLGKGKCLAEGGDVWQAIGCLDQLLYYAPEHAEAERLRDEWNRRLGDEAQG